MDHTQASAVYHAREAGVSSTTTIMRGRKYLSFPTIRKRSNADVVPDLVKQLWLINIQLKPYQLGAYREHLNECQAPKIDETVPCNSVSTILKLTDEIHAQSSESLDTIYDALTQLCSTPTTPVSAMSIHQALTYAMRLWLFLSLDNQLYKAPEQLSDIVQSVFSTDDFGPGTSKTLNNDFTIMPLSRIGGMNLAWTSDISRHLELHGNLIYCFKHCAALRALLSDGTS
jgi:hypothetical protein